MRHGEVAALGACADVDLGVVQHLEDYDEPGISDLHDGDGRLGPHVLPQLGVVHWPPDVDYLPAPQLARDRLALPWWWPLEV